jgi:hypothetical protein
LAEDERPGEFLWSPPANRPQPGECLPWRHKRAEIGEIQGDEALCRRVWQQIDALGNMFIWQVLVSF